MPKQTIVIDTNVLISAVLRFNSVSGLAFQKASVDAHLFYSDETLSEIIDVFSRKKFDKYISIHERNTFIASFLKAATRIDVPPLPIPVCRDPKDDKYLALALAGQSKFLITGDNDLLVLNPFENISIITPSDFLKLDM